MKILLLVLFLVIIVSSCKPEGYTYSSGVNDTVEQMKEEHPTIKGCASILYLDEYRGSDIDKFKSMFYEKKCIVSNNNSISGSSIFGIILFILLALFLIYGFSNVA